MIWYISNIWIIPNISKTLLPFSVLHIPYWNIWNEYGCSIVKSRGEELSWSKEDPLQTNFPENDQRGLGGLAGENFPLYQRTPAFTSHSTPHSAEVGCTVVTRGGQATCKAKGLLSALQWLRASQEREGRMDSLSFSPLSPGFLLRTQLKHSKFGGWQVKYVWVRVEGRDGLLWSSTSASSTLRLPLSHFQKGVLGQFQRRFWTWRNNQENCLPGRAVCQKEPQGDILWLWFRQLNLNEASPKSLETSCVVIDWHGVCVERIVGFIRRRRSNCFRLAFNWSLPKLCSQLIHKSTLESFHDPMNSSSSYAPSNAFYLMDHPHKWPQRPPDQLSPDSPETFSSSRNAKCDQTNCFSVHRAMTGRGRGFALTKGWFVPTAAILLGLCFSLTSALKNEFREYFLWPIIILLFTSLSS